MNGDLKSVNEVVNSAHMLSGMDSCSLWALIAVGAIGYIWWSKKQDLKNNEEWRTIREKQLVLEVERSELLRHLTDEVSSFKMLLTKYLIKE